MCPPYQVRAVLPAVVSVVVAGLPAVPEGVLGQGVVGLPLVGALLKANINLLE